VNGALQHCGSEQRRRRVAEAAIDTGGGVLLNGIDYLEVIDRDAPSDELRQRLIVLTFIRADGVRQGNVPLLARESFRIEGGTRIRGIEVEKVEPGADPNSLLLTVDRAGDYSPYRLSLQLGVANPEPPANMDRRLAAIDFTFKAECPSPFDCDPADAPPPPRDYGPPINYLAKDYESFRKLMLDRMSATLTDWTERSPADLGVMLVETLAYAADRTSWFQDAVGTEAYLGRARLRQSTLRHARLLGYRASEGTNARVAAAFAAALDLAPADPILPAGTRLLTRPPGLLGTIAPVVPRDAERLEEMIGSGSIVFETLEPLRSLKVARNEMRLHDWGDSACCLRPGSTGAWLVGTRAALGLAKGDLLILEERIPFGGSPDDPPDPAHRQLVRLAADPVDLHDPVMNVDLVAIEWHAGDALVFPLNLSGTDASPGAVVRGNVILADEGRTVDYRHSEHAELAGEDAIAVAGKKGGLLPDDGPGLRLRYRLAGAPVVHAVPFNLDQARLAPAIDAMRADGDRVASVRLDGDGEHWQVAPSGDLLASDRFAPDIKVEPGNGASYVLFGDGMAGRRPSENAAFTAVIRHGGGRRGNIGAGGIGHVVTEDGDAIAGVVNPLPALGGRDPEPAAAIRIGAPHAFRVQKRAVTPADYVAAAEEYADVQRAFANRRWTGSWQTLFLAVDRSGGDDIDPAFEAGLREHLASRRLAGHDLQIVPPHFAPLDIRLYVCVRDDHYAGDVERDLLDAFSSGFARDGQPAFFNPDNFSFGDNVLLSRILARAMLVDGVAWMGMRDGAGVVRGRFGRLDQPDIDYADGAEIPIAPDEVARLDNDPDFPDRGQLRFIMAGGR
jgi:hypothetical protein